MLPSWPVIGGVAPDAPSVRARTDRLVSVVDGMNALTSPQPDIKLVLDGHGVIREASVSRNVPTEDVQSWVGRLWTDTVADVGHDKVTSLLSDAREGGVSGFRQVNQRLPAGLEIPVEYTAVWLGGPLASTVAIGRNLQTVAELQSRLINTQQALERDYWKLREIETRYRQLFEASNEAVVLMRADNLRMVEANPAALRALGLVSRRRDVVADRELLASVDDAQREGLRAMLERAREQGKAPGVMIRLGPRLEPWIARTSHLRSEHGAVFLLQLSPVAHADDSAAPTDPPSTESLLARAPDAFVVIDRRGNICSANPAFAELVQVGSGRAVIGQPVERWFARPGTDLRVLLASVCEHGAVRGFPSVVRSTLGSDIAVEISAFGDRESDPEQIGLLVKDVGSARAMAGAMAGAGAASGLDGALMPLVERIGSAPMRRLVKETVEVMETRFIRRALDRTDGNRTAAAELLGLSRQSLYAKLGRYGIEPGSG